MKRLTSVIVSERAIVAVIVVNTLALLAMGWSSRGEPLYRFTHWIDFGCVVYFAVEVSLKIGREGWKGFWSSGWNRFDLIVVLASLPVLLSPAFPVDQLLAVPALRLGRLFRTFRLLRFIPNRDHLFTGVKRALRASVGVLLALLLVNLVLSLGAMQLFGDILPEKLGNPALASYSIFRVFTLEGWYELPDLIAERTDSAFVALLARAFFVGTVLVGGLVGLSLVDAVFVDEMTMDNTGKLEDKVDKLREEIARLREELRAR
ncbi:MAG: ion transporter [Deltaproteobacteria bacterium]|nr:ion transporter [Deltaproteobacteria bacterium]